MIVKKVLKAALIITLCMSLIGCGINYVIVDEHPIDTRYTESYQGVETTYKYIYDVFSKEGFKRVPYTQSVNIPEKYEVLYTIKYDNGMTTNEWREVSKTEFEKIKEEIEKGN